jgi:4-hydroxy-tetrahydrodipicolinate reductase
VTESHQSSKADTSGTAKAVVSHLVTLSADAFKEEDIVKLRERELQLAFKVPEAHLKGHAFHTYRLTSPDNRCVRWWRVPCEADNPNLLLLLTCPTPLPLSSVSFELQHNVCGRRVYAEGTADAVAFIHKMKASGSAKRLYNMIDVLESGQMN